MVTQPFLPGLLSADPADGKAGQEARFTTAEVTRAAGLTQRQVQWLIEKRAVTPQRSGHARAWSDADLFDLRLIAELRRRSVPLSQVIRAVRSVNASHSVRLRDRRTPIYVLLGRREILLGSNAEEVFRLLKEARRPMLLLDIGEIAGEVAHRLHAEAVGRKKPVAGERRKRAAERPVA